MFNDEFRHGFWAAISDRIRPGATLEELAQAAYASAGGVCDDPEESRNLVRNALKRHRNLPSVAELSLPDGRWLRQTKHGTPSGHVVSLFVDITDLKDTERELEANRKHLNAHIIELQDMKDRLEKRGDELVRTVAELAQARDAAEKASRAKSEFLATMSHEIRTPMNGVLGMANVLSQTGMNESQRDYLEIIQQSGEALLEIINDILDYSKMEAGQLALEHEEFSLLKVIDGSIRLLQTRYDEKGLMVKTLVDADVPDVIVGDAGRIRQILLNLVGNAIKFTESGSVTIHCQRPQPMGRHLELRFEVTDTGIGISEEVQKKLFRI